MSKRTKKALITIAIAAGLLVSYLLFYNTGDKGPAPVRTTGVVEALETSISAKIPGKLTYIAYREGERVKAGELVATLENADLEAAYAQGVSALDAARADALSVKDLVANAAAQVDVEKADIESAKAGLVRAQAQLTQSEVDLGRTEELYKKGIVSKSDLDNAHTLVNTRRADVESAKAAVALAKSKEIAARASLTKAKSDVKSSAAKISEAEHNVTFQKAKLADSKIYSPTDGVVEYRSLEVGEVVSPGTSILTILDLAHLWVRIDLEQQFVTRVKVGDRAEITLERVPGKVFEGTVFDIGREGEFATERDVTRGRQDIKTFRTRIRVKDPEGVLKPGMTVLVTIPEK